MTSEMENLRKELQRKKAQAAQLNKWAEAVTEDTVTSLARSSTSDYSTDSTFSVSPRGSNVEGAKTTYLLIEDFP